jgi:peroxiredoxin Q/BCP
MNVHISQPAPEFALPDQNGKLHRLSDYRGQWVVLYFYPKDDTSGCTAEACQMRDGLPDLAEIETVVLGVSIDSVVSHKKFADKYDLAFSLLSDDNKQVVGQYGLWGEKKFMGKTYLGTARTTFILDPQGVVVKIYEKVKPDGHAQQIIADLKNLQASLA